MDPITTCPSVLYNNEMTVCVVSLVSTRVCLCVSPCSGAFTVQYLSCLCPAAPPLVCTWAAPPAWASCQRCGCRWGSRPSSPVDRRRHVQVHIREKGNNTDIRRVVRQTAEITQFNFKEYLTPTRLFPLCLFAGFLYQQDYTKNTKPISTQLLGGWGLKKLLHFDADKGVRFRNCFSLKFQCTFSIFFTFSFIFFRV